MEAELKLVIAGNHDLDLDKEYFLKNLCVEEGDDPNEHDEAMEVMTGQLAKEAGVTYLEEGIHKFTLSSGASFKIYASPYQPVFGNFAFPYERNEDRFNLPRQIASDSGVKSISKNPIPDFDQDGVDIIMTHGPPKEILDQCLDGHVGCDNLMRAVSRARPLLHCFGHVHEGYGAKVVTWKDIDGKNVLGEEAIELSTPQMNAYPDSSYWPIKAGKETLMINAAIMDYNYRPGNAPWVIDLDLPRA